VRVQGRRGQRARRGQLGSLLFDVEREHRDDEVYSQGRGDSIMVKGIAIADRVWVTRPPESSASLG
jgi:hypothetical protein